jgi:anti-anti-sigma factor
MTGDARVGRLEISARDERGATVLRVEGEIDLASAEQFASGLRAASQAEGPVVIDLIAVPFMDSSGLKSLLAASSELGDGVVLAMSPGSPIVSLLDIAGVSDRFAVYPTAAAALDAVGDGQQ